VTAQPRQPDRRTGAARDQPARTRPAGGKRPDGDKSSRDQDSRDQDSRDQPAGDVTAAEMPYEQARDELIEVVRRLEGGGLTLEESLELWERGERLAAICSQWLEGARARLAAALPAKDAPGDSSAPF
jgi:exodeoxyribonuclease VII small subunit